MIASISIENLCFNDDGYLYCSLVRNVSKKKREEYNCVNEKTIE